MARLFDAGLAAAACVLATLLTIAVMIGVITRAVGEPLIWTDEASRFLMVWLAMVGWLMASRRGAHIRIRFFHDLLPPRLWLAAELVLQAAVVLGSALLAIFGIELIRRNLTIEATTLPVSMAWLYLPIVVAGAATAVQGVADCLAAAGKLRTGATADDASRPKQP